MLLAARQTVRARKSLSTLDKLDAHLTRLIQKERS